MEFPGTRLKQLLPVSRDDIDISQWKSGNEPITMTSIVDGEVVEHKPYDFSNIFHSQPAPAETPALSNEPSTIGVVPELMDDKIKSYIHHIKLSFDNAENSKSKITEFIVCMEGMTGTKTRHFYNNLLNIEDARYLEIGTWKGSSVCSAMCGNKAKVTCIDNWSEFGGPKSEFLANYEKFKGDNDANFIEEDCYKVDASTLSKFNIYMYDGNHSSDNHYKALLHYYECLDDVFIFIVDDWNWEDVRDGTIKSIQKLNLKVLYEREIRPTMDNSHTPHTDARHNWWNGIYVAVLQK
jgi:hypothetical protein